MNWIEVIVLALVEGVTEFLPISSTGHMILTSKLLGLSQTQFLSSFEIVVQLGAILAILSKYGSLLWKRKDYWPLILAAFVPTSVVGFVGYRLLKTVLLGSAEITLYGLLIGGVLILASQRLPLGKLTIGELGIKRSVLVGLLQAASIFPGISRSAATIIAGEMSGLSRRAAVEFSFLLGLPVLMAAAAYDLLNTGVAFATDEWLKLGVGIIVAFMVARWSVGWLVSFVERKSLAIFGWYRVVLALFWLVCDRIW